MPSWCFFYEGTRSLASESVFIFCESIVRSEQQIGEVTRWVNFFLLIHALSSARSHRRTIPHGEPNPSSLMTLDLYHPGFLSSFHHHCRDSFVTEEGACQRHTRTHGPRFTLFFCLFHFLSYLCIIRTSSAFFISLESMFLRKQKQRYISFFEPLHDRRRSIFEPESLKSFAYTPRTDMKKEINKRKWEKRKEKKNHNRERERTVQDVICIKSQRKYIIHEVTFSSWAICCNEDTIKQIRLYTVLREQD